MERCSYLHPPVTLLSSECCCEETTASEIKYLSLYPPSFTSLLLLSNPLSFHFNHATYLKGPVHHPINFSTISLTATFSRMCLPIVVTYSICISTETLKKGDATGQWSKTPEEVYSRMGLGKQTSTFGLAGSEPRSHAQPYRDAME